MSIKVCEQCGESYSPRTKTQRFCSTKCRHSWWEKFYYDQKKSSLICVCRRCGKQFSAANTQRRKFCSEECAKPTQPKIKVCEYCGEQYKPHKNRVAVQRFCSDACQRTWWSENRDESKKCGNQLIAKKNSERALVEKQCLVCNSVFKGTKSGSDYCSDECRAIGVVHTAICIQCGKEFETSHANAQICSDACDKQRNRQRFREHKRAIGRHQGRIEHLACEHCGKEFDYTVYNRVPRYCSPRCSKKAWYKTDAGKAEKRRQRQCRRAMKYGNGPVENIDPLQVFERDGWRCGICGKKVDPHLEHPHPMSVTLDHIVALANGGTHTLNNVQCAHLWCNSKKRDLGGGQLRLGLKDVAK